MIISESQQERYHTKISNENTSIYSDVIAASEGIDECFGPHDLLCSGIASCLNISTRLILERMNIPYEKIVVKVDINCDEEIKTKFIYDVEIDGELDELSKEIVMDKLMESPILKTLTKTIEFEELE